MNKKIIVIGGTAAGMTFASKLSRYKEKIEHVVYEKRDYVSLGACGIPFYVGGHAQKDSQLIALSLAKAKERGINVQPNHKVISVDFESKKVTVRNTKTEEEFIDTYSELFIGTGAHPIVPQFLGVKLKNVFTATTLEDARVLKEMALNDSLKEVTIIGSGFIGLEIAENLLKYGKNIRIFDTQDRPSSKTFDKEITDLLQEELEKNNVKTHYNESLEKIIGKENVSSITTNKDTYKADVVILAVGFKPTTNLFKDKLQLHDNGSIKINRKGQTSIDNVWSAGDCVSVYNPISKKSAYYPLATTSRKMATIVYENMVEKLDKKFIGAIGTAGFRFQNIELFTSGYTEESAKQNNIDVKTVFIKSGDSAGYAGETQALYLKMVANQDNVIIGAQAAGTNRAAAMRIMTLSVAIMNKMELDKIEQLDLFYAPPFSQATDIIHIAARILNKKGNKND